MNARVAVRGPAEDRRSVGQQAGQHFPDVVLSPEENGGNKDLVVGGNGKKPHCGLIAAHETQARQDVRLKRAYERRFSEPIDGGPERSDALGRTFEGRRPVLSEIGIGFKQVIEISSKSRSAALEYSRVHTQATPLSLDHGFHAVPHFDR